MAASSLRAKVKATEPLYSNESEQVHLAGQLLIHLATQNTFGGKRQLFPKGRDLLEESFSVDTGSECFRSYHIQAIRTALENENLQLTEILLAKDSTGDLLREELDLLPIAISGGDSEIELAATENTKFESKWECRRKRDASHISNIVHQLISHGAPLNELDSKGRSPLWFACFSGLPQTFDLLVTSGANIQTLHDPVSKAPLDGHDLVNTSSATKVNLLRIALDSRFNLEGFDHGCEPWMYDFNGGDELINLRKTLKTFDHIIFSLLDAGLTCPTSDPSLIKLFHQSCFEGNMSHVKSLLHYGVDVNAVDNRACQDRYGTALHTAAARGYKEIVSLLLLNSANPKVKRRVGPTIWACDSDIMSRKSLRVPMTAIHYALYNAEKVPIFQAYHRLDSILQCCEAILHVGASNRDGEMLLIEAIVTGRTTLTQRLLQRGIRKAYVFTLDLRCIERYLQAGISFDYRAYQMWVISFAKSHPFTMESRNLAPVLDLLVQKSKPLLPKEIIGEIAASMFRHKDVLHHLIKNYNIDVNTLFQVNHDYDDALHEKFPLRDLPTSKEAIPFNLLQKACSEITDENAGDLHDAIQLLLEQGASVDCFGLPKTAFEYLRETIQHLKATEKSFQYRTGMKSFELTIARILRLLLVADTNQKSTLQSSIASSLAESTYPEKATWQPLSKLLQFDQPLLDRSRVLYQGKFNTNTHVDTGIDDALHNAGLLSDIRGSRTLGVDSPFKHLDTHLNSTIHGPTRFEYQPLRGLQSIRLIALEPAESFEAPVRCQIYQTNLATARSFEALSYVWGKVTNLVPIALNGHVTDITQSLWCILCRLRNNSALRVLWIDALCINQEDIREKSHQVQMMREIYITAERVLVWLGEADIESHRVLQTVAAGSETREHFESMGDSKLSSNPDRIPDCAVASALHTIYCRPWFYRIWTLQELVLARKATMMLGPHILEWDDIHYFNKTLYGAQGPEHDLYGPPYAAITGVNKTGHWHALQNLVSESVKRNKDLHDILYSVLKYAAVCDASDPRDKVYGLLGLLERPLLTIDYTLSIEHIYRQFTETLITETESLHVLHMFGVKKRINTLPSWVPDYSICRPVATLPAAYCEQRESYYGQIKRTKWRRLWVEFRKDCLVTRGKRLCHIKTLGETLPANQAFAVGSHKFGLILRGWEEMILDVDASKSAIPICEAFMRAITAYDEDIDEPPQTLDFDWALCWYQKYGSNVLYDADDSTFQELRDSLDLMAWTMPKESYTQRLEEIINRFSKRVEDVCYERRFFIADDGNIGMAPSGSQPRDSIVMFQNGLYPFVVRPQENGMSTLIGDCFHYNLAEGKPTLYEQFVVEEDDWIEEEEQLGTNSDQGELQDNTEGAEVDQGTNAGETDEDWTEITREGVGGHGGDLLNDLYVLC